MWLSNLSKPWRAAIFAFGTVGLLLIFALYCFKILDPDFGWHLATGRYILAHGIPRRDLYSYTAPNFKWIDHEWLNDVIVAKLYGWGGFAVLGWLFAGMWTIGTILASRRYNFLILILAAAALGTYCGVRTITWTFLGLAILERMLESKRIGVLATIVPLMLLWSNLHGSFVIGFVVMAVNWWQKRDHRLLTILASSILVSFINPYGPRLYVEVARTLFDGSLHFQINEWLPLALKPATLAYVLPLVALVIVLKPKPWRWFVSLPGLFLAMALSSSRHAVLFVVGSIRHFEDLTHQAWQKVKPLELDWVRQVILAVFILVAFIVALSFPFQTVREGRELAYPVSVAKYLVGHPCRGQIFNEYQFGGYLIWKVPGIKLYIDGRMPSWRVNNQKLLANYGQILNNSDFRRQQFAHYGITCAVIMPPSSKHPENSLAYKLTQEGWQTAINEPGAVLLVAPR